MGLFSRNQPDIPRRRQGESSHQNVRANQDSLDQRYAFRRNRTLTGSSSSNVVSANESGAQMKSARVQVHELTQHRRSLWAIFSIVLLCGAVIYLLVSQFTSHAVVRANQLSILQPVYTTAIDTYLSQRPIERLRFFLNEETLSNYIRIATPEVKNITVEGWAGLGKTSFVLEMRKPIAGWSINGTQQYVDASGHAFKRNHFDTPPVQIIDRSGVQVSAGEAIASDAFLSFVGRVVGRAEKSGFTVQEVVIPQGTTRQLELKLGGVGYPIKLSVDRPAGEQIEDMSRAVAWLKLQEINPEYLDARVSGRVFYR